MFCQKCGTQNEDVARFCANCGETLDLGSSSNQAGAAPAAAPAAGFTPAPDAAKKAPDTKKLVKIAIAAVIAIVVVVLGFNIIKGLFGSKGVNYEKHPVIYVKDGDVMVQLAGKANADKAYELGSALEIDDVKVSDDGKYIFYSEVDGDSKDLYYRKAADDKGDGEKIKGGISSFEVAPNGKFVVYKKDGNLYFSNLKETEKIDNEVSEYYITADSKYVVFAIPEEQKTRDDFDSDEAYAEYSSNYEATFELHVRKATLKFNGETMVADEVVSYELPYEEETGKSLYKGVVYYEKDGDLWYVKNGKNAEKVVSDIYVFGYREDKFFAVSKDEKTVDKEDAVEIVKEGEGEYAYEYESVRYDDGYSVDYEDGKEVYKKSSYTLYSVSGKKAKELGTDYSSCGLSRAKKDDENFIIKKNGKIISVGELEDDASIATISEDEKYVFIKEDIKEGKYTLCRYKLGSKELGKKTVIAEDVKAFNLTEKGNVVLTTVDDKGNATLGTYTSKYLEIEEEVSEIAIIDNTVYFCEGYKNGAGTLYRLNVGKKEATKIDDDVYSLDVRSEKMCYYIKDYDGKDGGTLYLKKGNGKSKIVDEEVTGLMPNDTTYGLSYEEYYDAPVEYDNEEYDYEEYYEED